MGFYWCAAFCPLSSIIKFLAIFAGNHIVQISRRKCSTAFWHCASSKDHKTLGYLLLIKRPYYGDQLESARSHCISVWDSGAGNREKSQTIINWQQITKQCDSLTRCDLSTVLSIIKIRLNLFQLSFLSKRLQKGPLQMITEIRSVRSSFFQTKQLICAAAEVAVSVAG